MQRFNNMVEACAGNTVLVRLLDQARVFTRAQRRVRLLRHTAVNDQFGLDRYSSHRALVHALRAGDSATAEQLVLADARGGLDDLRREPSDQVPTHDR